LARKCGGILPEADTSCLLTILSVPFFARHMTHLTAYSPALVNLIKCFRPNKTIKIFFVLYKKTKVTSSRKNIF
jgi:hypothetical protein